MEILKNLGDLTCNNHLITISYIYKMSQFLVLVEHSKFISIFTKIFSSGLLFQASHVQATLASLSTHPNLTIQVSSSTHYYIQLFASSEEKNCNSISILKIKMSSFGNSNFFLTFPSVVNPNSLNPDPDTVPNQHFKWIRIRIRRVLIIQN